MDHQQLSAFAFRAYYEQHHEVANIEFIRGGNVLAFRGTDEIWDVIRDIRIFPWWNPGLGWSPAGFVKGAQRVYEEVIQVCDAEGIPPESLVLTGHSLGGAIAIIVGAIFAMNGVPVREVVAWGPPRCGRLAVLDETPTTIYRNARDGVLHVPPVMRMHKPYTAIGESVGGIMAPIKDHRMQRYVVADKGPLNEAHTLRS